MRFHNFLRSKQSLPPWLFPPKECLRSCLWLKFSQFSLSMQSAMPQTECPGLCFLLVQLVYLYNNRIFTNWQEDSCAPSLPGS